MARRSEYSPASLRRVSLLNVATHFESYWCAGRSTITLDCPTQLECPEPFEYLDDEIIQGILNVLVKKKLLQRHHFQFLLSSKMHRLRLRGKTADHFSVIRTVAGRCQKLRHLIVSGLSNVEDSVLCELATNLPHLEILDLSYTQTNHKVLKAVAEHCPKLYELHIAGCKSIRGRDYDIKEFCKIVKKQGVPQLLILDLFKSKVSTGTIVAVLDSQRNIRSLGRIALGIHNALCQMYGKIFLNNQTVPQEWVTRIFNLEISGFDRLSKILSESLCLGLTFMCCPYVIDLTLSNITELGSLRHISMLKHLHILKVSGSNNIPISFREYLLPVLKELGTKLTLVDFTMVFDVDFLLIGELCPKLESLSLLMVDGDTEQTPAYHASDNTVACFTNLKKMDFRNCTYADPSYSEELSTALVNASSLENLVIHYSGLTDEVISKAYETHNFKHLEIACFGYCHSISVQTGMILLSYDNSLRCLEFDCCSKLKGKDSDQLKEEAIRMGVKLEVTWKYICVH